MGTKDPPLRTLSFRETFEKFCNGESSFKSSLFTMLEKLEESELKKDSKTLFWEASDISISEEMTDEECKMQYMKVLDKLKELSFVIRQIKSNVLFTEALSDILYLYAHTYTYFTPTESYKRFYGEEVCVRK